MTSEFSFTWFSLFLQVGWIYFGLSAIIHQVGSYWGGGANALTNNKMPIESLPMHKFERWMKTTTTPLAL